MEQFLSKLSVYFLREKQKGRGEYTEDGIYYLRSDVVRCGGKMCVSMHAHTCMQVDMIIYVYIFSYTLKYV